MALTQLQRAICRLIAGNRIDSGESYVAGGVALNELIAAPRISRDIDLFHDSLLFHAGRIRGAYPRLIEPGGLA
jgi:hypothetical protein